MMINSTKDLTINLVQEFHELYKSHSSDEFHTLKVPKRAFKLNNSINVLNARFKRKQCKFNSIKSVLMVWIIRSNIFCTWGKFQSTLQSSYESTKDTLLTIYQIHDVDMNVVFIIHLLLFFLIIANCLISFSRWYNPGQLPRNAEIDTKDIAFKIKVNNSKFLSANSHCSFHFAPPVLKSVR